MQAMALSEAKAMALIYAIGFTAAMFFLAFFLMEMESSDGRWLSKQGFQLARSKSGAKVGSLGSTADWFEIDKTQERLMDLAKKIDCAYCSQSSSGLATHTGTYNATALFFMADYQNFPSDTPVDELFYLKAVLLARIFNPTVPVYFLLPKAVLALHPEVAKVLGDYRINIRWIDFYLKQHYFITFEEKHKAFCERLNIPDCFRDDMYHRFGMAAQILKVEGFTRAIFLDNDVALYSDISFITKYSEHFVSPYEWSSQAALWDVDVMDKYYKWLMHFFDTEPLGKELDPGDMHGVRIFLERHPLVSRRILCGKESWWYCASSPDYWQAMENVGVRLILCLWSGPTEAMSGLH
jgi:hypothetical protein